MTVLGTFHQRDPHTAYPTWITLQMDTDIKSSAEELALASRGTKERNAPPKNQRLIKTVKSWTEMIAWWHLAFYVLRSQGDLEQNSPIPMPLTVVMTSLISANSAGREKILDSGLSLSLPLFTHESPWSRVSNSCLPWHRHPSVKCSIESWNQPMSRGRSSQASWKRQFR